MIESELSPPEQEPIHEITKEEVVAAYGRFVERGITNPDDLDLEDPEVKEANELFYKWVKQEDERAVGNEELKHRANLSQTMFYIDAGFTDPEYLEEVRDDFLEQMDEDIEEQPDNPERIETRRLIAEAMLRVEKLLAEQG